MILRYPNPVLYSCKIVSKNSGGILLGLPGPRLSPLPCSEVMFLQSLLIPGGQQLQAWEDRHTPGKGNLQESLDDQDALCGESEHLNSPDGADDDEVRI